MLGINRYFDMLVCNTVVMYWQCFMIPLYWLHVAASERWISSIAKLLKEETARFFNSQPGKRNLKYLYE